MQIHKWHDIRDQIKRTPEDKAQLEMDAQEILDRVIEELPIQDTRHPIAVSLDSFFLASKMKTYCGIESKEAEARIKGLTSRFKRAAESTGRTRITMQEAIKIVDKLNGAS